jgi:hypothetical protein
VITAGGFVGILIVAEEDVIERELVVEISSCHDVESLLRATATTT